MTDFLDQVCHDVAKRIADGAYDARPDEPVRRTPSLVDAVREGEAIVAEVKRDAPSWDAPSDVDPIAQARAYRDALVAGISVVTERDHFGGTIELLGGIATLGRPTLMKDFLIDEAQIDAADAHGAAAVLAIQAVFDREVADRDALVDAAHDAGLEVLLEASTAEELDRALGSDADIVAVNARRLDTLDVSLDRAVGILEDRDVDRPAMILSAISSREDVRRAFDAGADGVLVGSALMRSDDPAGVIAKWRA